MNLISEAELTGIVDEMESVFNELLLLVPEHERGKAKAKKAVLKYLQDEVRRVFLAKMDLLEPFRMKDEEQNVEVTYDNI